MVTRCEKAYALLGLRVGCRCFFFVLVILETRFEVSALKGFGKWVQNQSVKGWCYLQVVVGVVEVEAPEKPP